MSVWLGEVYILHQKLVWSITNLNWFTKSNKISNIWLVKATGKQFRLIASGSSTGEFKDTGRLLVLTPSESLLPRCIVHVAWIIFTKWHAFVASLALKNKPCCSYFLVAAIHTNILILYDLCCRHQIWFILAWNNHWSHFTIYYISFPIMCQC